MWLDTYTPFGLEVIETRYGGLMTRIDSLKRRIDDYLQDKSRKMPEFETELLEFDGLWQPLYRRIVTPTVIF